MGEIRRGQEIEVGEGARAEQRTRWRGRDGDEMRGEKK